MSFAALPNDGFEIPDDNPKGQETYGAWTLRWSGWQQGVSPSGYAFKKDGYWWAFRTDTDEATARGDFEMVVSMVNGPTFIARNGDVLPECVGLSMTVPSARLAERANALKAEARARLLDRIDSAFPIDVEAERHA